ncbi:Gfo/Idh/MocA family oxidoreductase [Phytoactinopolyspora alkaliphila]|uniref:Gfo/Idh/MocA family oxidoreductase n=1 Tax=Phytoactinopolyspora alkaliphila TaxID=1783498 RepID=A0A6N9YP25_9ACTN|nr:Gfo/Idh/MocA family oxidoreductase [Phytoactinopolyspora alkaliphila]NED96598.1 Gfo/Idh/MocA family oxidoreductase [Phytoactinopolyspora alkaliphila]
MKIGVLSFAHLHAASYVQNLLAMPDVDVLATDPGHAERPGESGGPELAAEFGVDYVDSIDGLLAWRPDGVVVCSENAHHRAHVERAAAAGAHVLCEKPLATSVADAEAMVRACAEAGVHLMVAYPVRFSPAFTALREAVEKGAVGAVRAITGTNNGRLPAGRAWFTDPALAGGGAMTDHTVHVADLVDSLLSGTPAVSVYAQSNRVLHHDDVSVETAGLVSVEYENGVVMTVDCSWSKPDTYPTWGGLTLQVVGSAGVADMDAFGQRVDGFAAEQGTQVWLPYGAGADDALLDAFLEGIRTGVPPQPDGMVGVRTAQIVEAGYASAASGQPVRL